MADGRSVAGVVTLNVLPAGAGGGGMSVVSAGRACGEVSA